MDYHTKRFPGHLKDMTCYNIYNSLVISPYGDMFLCGNYKIGNIKDGPVKDAWNNEKARLLRTQYEKGYFPACQRCGGFSER